MSSCGCKAEVRSVPKEPYAGGRALAGEGVVEAKRMSSILSLASADIGTVDAISMDQQDTPGESTDHKGDCSEARREKGKSGCHRGQKVEQRSRRKERQSTLGPPWKGTPALNVDGLWVTGKTLVTIKRDASFMEQRHRRCISRAEEIET